MKSTTNHIQRPPPPQDLAEDHAEIWRATVTGAERGCIEWTRMDVKTFAQNFWSLF